VATGLPFSKRYGAIMEKNMALVIAKSQIILFFPTLFSMPKKDNARKREPVSIIPKLKLIITLIKDARIVSER
jgi:hypothetical protein